MSPAGFPPGERGAYAAIGRLAGADPGRRATGDGERCQGRGSDPD